MTNQPSSTVPGDSPAIDPCLAVIPARGGSKGLPGKNVRPMLGRPLIGHTIACAGLAPRIATTIVSTDSPEIAEAARREGARVPFLRPAELAGDDVAMAPVLRHALGEMERIDGRRYETLLLLDPTAPARLPSDIDEAFRLLEAHPAADGVIAVSQPRFNFLWVGAVVDNGYLAPAFGEKAAFVRRQDVPRALRVNGLLYLWRRDYLMEAHPYWWQGRILPLEIPEERAFSIDDLYEFQLAETYLASGRVALPWLATTGGSDER